MIKKNKPTGAGIVCYFDNRQSKLKDYKSDILYLCLVTRQNRYDFPKGCIDEGESIEQCALRETYEECNLDLFDFESISNDYFECGRGLFMFLGRIKEDSIKNIKIKKNPKIPIYEHISFKLLPYEEVLKEIKQKQKAVLLSYLKSPLDWADSIIR
tara:strand:+ start:54 stop:521 length:468 start_codon:yes stop_codon:yes gene_type:complete